MPHSKTGRKKSPKRILARRRTPPAIDSVFPPVLGLSSRNRVPAVSMTGSHRYESSATRQAIPFGGNSNPRNSSAAQHRLAADGDRSINESPPDEAGR